MRRASVVASLVLVGSALFVVSASADSVAPGQQGWWSEAQQAPGAPLPINQATGTNLQVGGDPTGPNAVAALRYTVPGTVDGMAVDPATVSAILTLHTAAPVAGTPAVYACPVTGPWQPALGGAWTAQPKYACASFSAGTFSTDGTIATFDLTTQLQTGPGVYDLALVPKPGNQTPFSVQFLAPAADSLALGSATAAPAGGSAVETPVEPQPSVDVGAPADQTPAGSPDFSTAPALPLTPSPSPAQAATRNSPRANSLLPAPIRRAVSSTRDEQVIALTLLFAIGFMLWWFGGAQARAPRLLGSLGEGVNVDEVNVYVLSGGIGRFARPRTRPPVRL